MINFRKNSVCLLAAAALGISAVGLSASTVWAAAAAPSEVKQDLAKEHQERFKHFADKLADRLEIKASQQNAFAAFLKTLEAATEHPAKKQDVKTDAASIARQHAEMAAAHAQKLAQIADATAKLQEVLSPEQRKTLDQIAAHFAGRHGHHFHGGDQGEHSRESHGQWERHDKGSVHDRDGEHEQH